MTTRGTVLLAVGALVVGLLLGAVIGGLGGLFAAQILSPGAARAALFVQRSARVLPVPETRWPFAQLSPRWFWPHGRLFREQPQPAQPTSTPTPSPQPSPTPTARAQATPPSVQAPNRSTKRFPAAPNFPAGARVSSVVPNSPAEKAGLRAGDTITAVDGTTVDPKHSLSDLIQAHKPGDTVSLSVERGFRSLTVNVELGASAANSSQAYLGIEYTPTFSIIRVPRPEISDTPSPSPTTPGTATPNPTIPSPAPSTPATAG